MKIKKLIELLKAQPQNNEVLLSIDNEGNVFKEIGGKYFTSIEKDKNKTIIFPMISVGIMKKMKKGI